MSIPTHFGDYQVVGHLATGGMAEVYVACHRHRPEDEGLVCIKRVLPHLARMNRFRSMFVEEVRVLRALEHPNIVRVHSLVEDPQELYAVMEYLHGESLSRLLRVARRESRLSSWEHGAFIVKEACAALIAAHTHRVDGELRPVIHRDLSPHNILLTYSGNVKVIDFGIAKADDSAHRTRPGELKGKIAYMSPEQVTGEELDGRSDLFSLGIVLFEATTGRRLFRRKTDMETLGAVVKHAVPFPSTVAPFPYPPELEQIVMHALERGRADRFQNASEMHEALSAVLGPDDTSQSDLSALMHAAFERRIAKKEALFAGFAPARSKIFSWASEEAIELSKSMSSSLPPRRTQSSSAPSITEQRPGAHRPHTGWWVAGAASACLIGFTVGFTLWTRQGGDGGLEPAPFQTPAGAQAAATSLSVEAEPIGSEVFINGVFVGIAPLRHTSELPAGEVAVTVRHEGFRPATQTRTVEPGGALRLSFDLEPTRRAPAGAASSAQRAEDAPASDLAPSSAGQAGEAAPSPAAVPGVRNRRAGRPRRGRPRAVRSVAPAEPEVTAPPASSPGAEAPELPPEPAPEPAEPDRGGFYRFE